PSWAVYLFAFAAALATGLIFGAVPARQIWNADPNQALRGGTLSPVLGRRWALRDALLAIQIALCCLLVTASFVSLRGLAKTFSCRWASILTASLWPHSIFNSLITTVPKLEWCNSACGNRTPNCRELQRRRTETR